MEKLEFVLIDGAGGFRRKGVRKIELLMSDDVREEILNFSRRWNASDPMFTEFKIAITFSNISLIFFQPERYVQLVASYITFFDDVGFFFEDVCCAIAERDNSEQENDEQQSCLMDVLERNDAYVRRVLEYFERNMELLASIPPPWFQRAVEISDAAIRKNFPDMADADSQAKLELWESWQKH